MPRPRSRFHAAPPASATPTPGLSRPPLGAWLDQRVVVSAILWGNADRLMNAAVAGSPISGCCRRRRCRRFSLRLRRGFGRRRAIPSSMALRSGRQHAAQAAALAGRAGSWPIWRSRWRLLTFEEPVCCFSCCARKFPPPRGYASSTTTCRRSNFGRSIPSIPFHSFHPFQTLFGGLYQKVRGRSPQLARKGRAVGRRRRRIAQPDAGQKASAADLRLAAVGADAIGVAGRQAPRADDVGKSGPSMANGLTASSAKLVSARIGQTEHRLGFRPRWPSPQPTLRPKPGGHILQRRARAATTCLRAAPALACGRSGAAGLHRHQLRQSLVHSRPASAEIPALQPRPRRGCCRPAHRPPAATRVEPARGRQLSARSATSSCTRRQWDGSSMA